MLTAILLIFTSLPSGILYWIKWLIARLAIRRYNSTHRRRFDIYKPNAVGDPEKLGFLTPQIEVDLESPQSEKHLQNFADEVLFYGVNSKSECVLIRLSRHRNQWADAWIYMRMADGTTYQLEEPVDCQHSDDEESFSFSCGNLRMKAAYPMRRWRIEYCGTLLQKSKSNETLQKSTFVKFMFLWCASSDVYDVYDPTVDMNIKKFTHSLAVMEWTPIYSPPLQQFLAARNSYIQVGNLRGTVTVDDKYDYEMYLFGDKQRNLGERKETAFSGYPLIMGYVPQNGCGVHLTNNLNKNLHGIESGFVIQPDGTINAFKDTLIPFHQPSGDTLSGTFTTVKGMKYELQCHVTKDCIELHSKDGFSRISFVEFSLMNKTGYGFYFTSREYGNTSDENVVPIIKTLRPKIVPLVVKFADEISRFGHISGGKGSSLGKLTKLNKRNKTFAVPKGIIVTTSSYEKFLNCNILTAIEELEKVVYGKVDKDIKKTYDNFMKSFLEGNLPDEVCDSITENLKIVFGDDFKNIKFAVRSSATGEDTEVMSAAGQMDTFLGIKGLQNVFDAVKKCWASQFSLTAVEYKRQHGQLLNSPMAVVIQEMVACQVSGVMFTCDPVSYNPNSITITANYGLGETVVSGSVEPDTFVLRKNGRGTPTIESITIGSKLKKEVMNESGGTRVEELPEVQKSISCLSSEMVERLGELAIEVEKFFRSSRDIEWGVEQNNIYLLQSRPVTGGNLLTDFELKHEFNTSLRCERDYFTRANVGEVLPGLTPPLASEMGSKLFNKAMQKLAFDNGLKEIAQKVYCPWDMFYYQLVMTVPEITCRHGHDTILSKGSLISMFGRILEETEIFEIARERYPSSMTPPLWIQLFIFKELMMYDRGLDELKKRVQSYDLPFMKCETAEETFNALMKSCSDFFEPAIRHMVCSGNSSHWNAILFAILVKARGCIDADVYSDFGKILATTSDVESADVPTSMQKLALQIVEDVGATTFKDMSLKEAEEWLNNSKSLSSKLYQQFIKRHGHRCLKEYAIHSVTWEENQENLIKILQASVGSTKSISKKIDKSFSKLLSELSSPLSYWYRLLLRFVIPNCHKGVSCREFTKSVVVKCVDYWRKGFRRLGRQMVSEGRIPDNDLIYYMMLDEIRNLLKTRDPMIIIRSNQRRKIFPTLEKYKLSELIRGYPKAGDEDPLETEKHAADLTIKGVPVSQGSVKGYARVATSLEEAANIQPGEILIAYSTDIGWSPYFPIISGVATELGGLISHGAVVSREYGLPCVVGVHGATKMFKTGDYVFLDGRKGILQRLPQPNI